jgi:AcrR family transcriptional regulator
MPAATRERALEAAVELLGAEGVRALSHARVDERAGLPPGSTSNWFRTRRALLGGIVDWIAERERADFDPSALATLSGVDELIDGLCAVIELQSGPFAARTRARYALFLELADDPELGEPLRRQRHEFERWTRQRLPRGARRRGASLPARPRAVRDAPRAVRRALLAVVLAATGCGGAELEPVRTPAVPDSPDALRIVRVPRRFQAPVQVAAAGARTYVAEQSGRVRTLHDGGVVLDLRRRVAHAGEQGLLALAVHPRDPSRLFVHYTDRAGDTVVAEYRAGRGIGRWRSSPCWVAAPWSSSACSRRTSRPG